MDRIIILCAVICSVAANSTYYNSYYGFPLTSTQASAFTANGTLANCTNLVETCNATEPRRIDGTCNNLAHPSYGATRTPYYRLLSPRYYNPTASRWLPRKAADGSDLVLARVARTTIWAEGRVEDETLTSLITHYAVFFATDITNTRDTSNYVLWRPYCCKSAGRDDPACAPNEVPQDDFVHRFSDIRCLNMTAPLTFQTSQCLPNTTTPLRIVDATPTNDLSPIYGNVIETARRTYKNGMLNTDVVNGKSFPPTSGINLLLGVNFFGIIFFWRYHNYIASQLAVVNPCWTDDRLFNTAREINIAVGVQIYYYELMATLMGEDNLIKDGVLSNSTGFRDLYNSSVLPQISLEYPVALRFMHSFQDGNLKMYYTNGTYKSSYPIVNLTSNTDMLKEGDNMVYVTQSCFRQPTGKTDDGVVDPDIVERGLGGLQKSNDIMTNDLAKGRYFGFQGYIKYRALCFGENITSFDDLNDIKPERIQQLKDMYKSVEDIDLLAGIWVETLLTDAFVPPTFYCIVKDQLKRTLVSDRHWYERKNRPNAFTATQLAEIRKASAGRMLCDIGDGVTEIQPQAFRLPCSTNEITSCDDIDGPDFTAWKDSTCTSS